jgi:hypothetical protein
MRPRLDLVILTALGAALIAAPSAPAQRGLDFVPFAGFYAPTTNMMNPAFPGVPAMTQRSSVLGGRVTWWLPSRVGIEGTLAYAPSNVNPSATYDCCDAAHVITASARVLAPVLSVGGSPLLRVGGGMGVVSHGGRAYANTSGATSIAGIASAGMALRLGPTPLMLRLDAEDYLFKPHLGAQPGCDRAGYTGFCGQLLRAPTAFKPQFQNDVVLSVGLAFAAGRR